MCALRFLYGVTLGHDAIPERFSYSDGKVRFTWKDYRLDGTTKLMTLDANEFIRRFLLHALRASTGFVTTASSPTANAATPLSAACCSMPITPWPIQSWRTVTPKAIGRHNDASDFLICPDCCGTMRRIGGFAAVPRSSTYQPFPL